MPPTSILHIEDNFHNRRLVRKILESKGYTVIDAETGQMGLDLMRRYQPSLVLMDIGLPDFDGVVLLQMAKADATLRHIPLVAITARALQGDRERFMAAGFNNYLAKPVQPLTLLDAVQAHLPLVFVG